MKSFEDLLKLDIMEISSRTFIPVDEIKAMKEGQFDYFSRAKAIGFAKILEREYGIDMSQWLEEYEEYLKQNNKDVQNEEVFVVPEDSEPSLFENKKIIFSMLGVFVVIVFIGLYFATLSKDDEENIINAAKEQNIQNLNSAIQKQELEKATENNETKTIQEKEEEKEKEVQKKVIKDIFYIEPKTKLWIGITYENKRKVNKIITDKFELNATRNQSIICGHGYFKLVFNDKIYEPNSANVIKIKYSNKTITIKETVPKKAKKPIAKEEKQNSAPTNETVEQENNKKESFATKDLQNKEETKEIETNQTNQ